ncbi:MBL fold metallo-hydrolase [Paenirhodobacter populi]|uniref:MBL fold metallo-hydrolase n=1 Tax=Paenirhodobacter populi TaxID=2306993 RepID=A0A443JSX8_9RHOB|nr:MBL fold metallo-hydrolase [Sinirhodobacter populi]RWR23619.1 MBL fold metallo-hydrolase [Sinirhodobacter populi]
MKTTWCNRRTALITAAGTLAAPALLPVRAAASETDAEIPAFAPYRRLKLGAFTVTPLLAGARALDDPHGTFGVNVSEEEFAAVSAAAFLPTERSMNFFTPVLVETGSETVLFDTGLGPEGIRSALKAAGKTPEDVTLVIITHMHGDHIGGLMAGGQPTFPNARYVTGQVEYDHWAAAGNEGFDTKVRPLTFDFVEDGASPVPGITAVFAPGHTPGHMAYRLESEGKALMLTADTANHYVWSVGQPDWEVRFDMDKPTAAETRKRILGQIAEEKIPFIGYHMPFPAVGYLVAEGPGFRFVPASYQLDL